ncbi:BgTH12-06568 [Blumeria graminis f. sp. triticale]|uniref:Mediator of RNA polymerase II transcription subunit 1 n=1 Tax=Blumeria graminis f. sp. triticale TaxID=1689686 RepID=A0A9W4CYE4_BLUGR|nr:BgTH12-06568 [Blumeria graminis f. sp. triticale]
MSTPTPGKGTAPGNTVATPPLTAAYLAPSNQVHSALTPRGSQAIAPSPQQLKKSPITSQIAYGHGAAGSFGTGYDSPSAATALGSIAGLGDLGLDVLGGVSGLRRDDEEDRRRKLEMVSEILKANKGRVSEPGIERLARRVGFECLWESHTTSGSNRRTLIIAGSTLALDIDFENNVVKKVSITFPDSPEIVTRHTDIASDLLLKDLTIQVNENPLTKMLNRFAENLERLAALDKMSALPDLNCHEAIAGMFESLNRLYRWEMDYYSKIEEDGNIEKLIMCAKSGRPAMHIRERVGLSLDYWQDLWRLKSNPQENVWSILIECDTILDLVYTPIRVSENWISTEVEKKNAHDQDEMMTTKLEPILDWLEPESTLLPSTNADSISELGVQRGQKFPDAMFVAKFYPPLTVPSSLAIQIYDSVQATLDIYQTTTYDRLIFPPKIDEKISLDSRSIYCDVQVPTYPKPGQKKLKDYKFSLHFEKIDYGRTLKELPFSHPRQLVQMLPVLRQYAVMSRILQNTSGISSSNFNSSSSFTETKQKSKREEFEYLMTDKSDRCEPLRVDVLVYTVPFPRLRVLFPSKKKVIDVLFEIKLNGSIEVMSQNILIDDVAESPPGKKTLTEADLGRILSVSENLGIWIEFVRKYLK